MMILKSPWEIDLMRKSSRIVAETLDRLARLIEPGLTTLELDRLAESYILRRGGKSAFKGYRGYPYTLCASVNEQVVHAFPSARRLGEGVGGGQAFDCRDSRGSDTGDDSCAAWESSL